MSFKFRSLFICFYWTNGIGLIGLLKCGVWSIYKAKGSQLLNSEFCPTLLYMDCLC